MPMGNMMFGGQLPIGNNWQQALASKLFGGGGTTGQSPGPDADMAMAQFLGLYQPQAGGMGAMQGGMQRPMTPPGGYGMGFGNGLYGQPLPGGMGGGSRFANQVELQRPQPVAPQPMPAPAPQPAPMAPKPMQPQRLGNAAFQGRMGAQAFEQMAEGLSTPQRNMLRRQYGL